MKRNILVLFLIIASLFILISCNNEEAPPITHDEVEITLNETEIILGASETFQMEAEVLNSDESVTWSVDDSNIATISQSGLITALETGVTHGHATIGEVSSSVKITVIDESFPTLILSHTTVEILEGSEGFKVTAQVYFEGEVQDVEFEWIVEDASIVSVTEGVVTPLKAGDTIITVKTTFNNTLLEETITVKVKIEASLELSENNFVLNVVKVGDLGKTTATASAIAKISGVEVFDKEIIFITEDDDLVDLSSTDGTVTIVAKEIGTAVVKAGFYIDDVFVFSEINIVVEKLNVVIDKIFEVDISDDDSLHLDLDDYTWKDDVLEILESNVVISTNSEPTTIKQEWIQMQSLGAKFDIVLATKYVDYKANLKISQDYQEVGFKMAGASSETNYVKTFEGDKTEIGFNDDDQVYEYAIAESGWATRAVTDVKISAYDWFIFDFVFFDTPTTGGNFNIWNGTDHVILLNFNGSISVLQAGPNYTPGVDKLDHLKVYLNNKLHTGSFELGVKYTVELNMKYRGSTDDDFIGFKDSEKIYLGNAKAVSHSYYEKHFADKDEGDSNILNVEMNLTGGNATFDKQQPAFGFDNIWLYNSTGSLWGDRIQVINPTIKDYDYFVVYMSVTKALTKDLSFWMDTAVGDVNVTRMHANGTFSKDRIQVFDKDRNPHVGPLVPGDIYEFVIKLGHGDPDSRYSLGAEEATSIYIAETHVITNEVYEERYLPGEVVPEAELVVSEDEVILSINSDELTVSANVYLENELQDVEIIWAVTDDSIVSVLDGVITPLKIGETTIIVSAIFDDKPLEKTIVVIVKDEGYSNILNVEMNLTGGSATFEKQQPAFGFDNIWLYKSTGSLWGDRIQVINPTIKDYDYFVVYMSITKVLTKDLSFWMDTAVGDVNVTKMYANGTFSTDRIQVFDKDRNPHVGPLVPGDIYEFVIELGHGDPSSRYSLGAEEATSIYIAETHVITNEVYEDRYVTAKLEVLNLDFETVGESDSTYEEVLTGKEDLGFNLEDRVFKFENKTTTASNRLHVVNPLITDYDYIVFEIMFEEKLSTYLQLSMSYGNDIIRQPNGKYDKGGANLTILDNEGNEVSGELESGVVYTFVVKIIHGANNSYAIIIRDILNVYIANPIAITSETKAELF